MIIVICASSGKNEEKKETKSQKAENVEVAHNNEQPEKQDNKEEQPKKQEEKPVEEKVEKETKPKTTKKSTKEPVAKKETKATKPVKEDKKQEEKVEEVKEEEKQETEEVKAEKQSRQKYMVIYDKDKKDWIVKKTDSARASKRCKTKAEALEVAKSLSEKQDLSLTVKKKDGKFQKQR